MEFNSGFKGLNTPVQRLKVAILPLDLPCSGPVTHSGEILTTGKSHGKKPDRTWDRNGSTSGPTPWQIYDDDDDDYVYSYLLGEGGSSFTSANAYWALNILSANVCLAYWWRRCLGSNITRWPFILCSKNIFSKNSCVFSWLYFEVWARRGTNCQNGCCSFNDPCIRKVW